MFGSLLFSAGTRHGNLHPLSVTMSKVTCFILLAHTRTGVSYSQHRKNSGAGEWIRRVEMSKEEIPGSRRSMHGYIWTCSKIKRENL